MSINSNRERAAAIQQAHSSRAEQIRGRTELTDAAKVGMLARNHTDAKVAMRDLEQQAADAAAVQRRTASQKAFGVAGVAGDPAIVQVSMRDAQDRAATLTAGRDAVALLARAESSGDEVLARAVASVAFQQATARGGISSLDDQWSEAVNSFAGSRPAAADAIRSLIDLNSGVPGWTYLVPLPPELHGIPSAQLDSLADSAA